MATISPFEYMLGTSMKLSFVAAEVNLTSQGTFSFADMTVCTLMPPVKRLYVPFTAMITAHLTILSLFKHFISCPYTGCPKKCVPFSCYILFCDENKDNNLG